MTSLTDLGIHYGTDKATHHGYTDFYETILRPFRKNPISFLEIGVAGGESIRMWNEWFHHRETRIYGIEIQDTDSAKADYGPRTKIYITDAVSPNAVYDITNETGPLDIVLDDGSHRSDHLKASLSMWWPHIKPGGFFIAEDLHAQFHYPWTDQGEVKFTDTLLPWLDRVNENGKDDCGKPTDGDVEEIIFRKSLLIIKKR
jgi:methyltransferase family protein